MVALWGQIKRHYVLFKALKQINDPSYKVCLVGGPWGLTRSHIEQMADFYGVRANCDFYERLKPPQVNEMLNKSKVNVLLTLKEGANKSIFEGFFANVPGIVLKNNYGVNKKLINQHTGKLIDEVELAETLLWFRDHYRNFHARKWAMDHISPNKSTMQLQSALQRIAHEMGEPWTTDIAVKVNRPECEYYDSSVQISPFDLMAYKKSVT